MHNSSDFSAQKFWPSEKSTLDNNDSSLGSAWQDTDIVKYDFSALTAFTLSGSST